MPTIFIDDKPYEYKEGQNVLEIAVSQGLNLPYFCWHPALGSAGACRQCAVQHYKDENDTQGRMVMSCMTPAAEGSRFSINNPTCKSFRSDVIEWMMTNHPHDCPVCDEGGECHLQDMTVMTGHNKRDYRFPKRTYRNQDLGPNIHHEMNRCITCYRCTRFYRDVAGGEDLHSFSSSGNLYFGRYEDGALESEFSGNLVEICPTGVFTDKTFRAHHTRKWDLQTAPSVCQKCSLGCNISPGTRLSKLRRVQNRFHPEINGYFLCDKGRFGHQFVNSEDLIPAVSEIKALSNKENLVGIGSPRASIEANYALFKLVGADNFYDSHAEPEHKMLKRIMSILSKNPDTASLEEVRKSDCIVVLGEDLTQTAPMLALSIRQNIHYQWQQQAADKKIPDWNDLAVRNAECELPETFYLACDSETKLDKLATEKISLDSKSILELSAKLKMAKNPVIITGTSLGREDLIELSEKLKEAAPQAKLSYVMPAVNSFGLSLLKPKSLSELSKKIKSAIILEADLSKEVLEKFEDITVIDFQETKTSQTAQTNLGCASFAESTGTLVNNEGRAQMAYSVFKRREAREESWRILNKLGDLNWNTLEDLSENLAKDFPVFASYIKHTHSPDFRVHNEKTPRQTNKSSGRTAMNADLSMHEQAPPQDLDSPLSYSMEGYQGKDTPADLASFYWRPGWNSSQSFNALSHGTSGVKLEPS